MKCPEKEDLQRRCSAAWDAYAAAAAARNPIPTTISELVELRKGDLLRLRGEHLRSSMELSRHLSRHRC